MNDSHYCPHTPEEIAGMLSVIGVASVEELFAPIPTALRAKSFNLPAGMSEFETYDRMKAIAGDNTQGVTNFIGGGFYDHIIPAVVDHLSGRAEFYTAYTPYQPECSQGTLQALFEYQTAICRLTGLDVSNASLYDGGTACAEAAMMALRVTGRNKIVLDGCVSPFSRQVVKTYLFNQDVEVIVLAPQNGLLNRTELASLLDDSVAAVLVQNPNFFGDGQSLANPPSFGGPSFGFIAAKKSYIRNMPGRIVGETVDKNGKRGFVLTLQAREQHIKRHKATSNICSNQSLCALRGLIFLASLGKEGLVELARLNYDKAEYAKEKLGAIKGVAVLNIAATFNEFTLALPQDAAGLVGKLLQQGIAAGVPLGSYYPELAHCLVVTVTEKRSREEIDTLAKAIEGAL